MTITEYIIDRVRLNPQREPPLLFPADRWGWLPDLCNLYDLKRGAEIGVSGGRFSRRLLASVPGLTLYSIDPWAEDDRIYHKALRTLGPFENCHVMRDYSLDVVDLFDDGGLDFFYLDADRRYASVTEDLDAWVPKLRPGGLVCGCCYYNLPGGERVKDAVDDWTAANGIETWFVLVHHRYPCYLWEKV